MSEDIFKAPRRYAAGTNLVTVDGTGATSVVVVDDTTITCVAPAGNAGTTVDVVVTNDNGVATLASGFTYHALPTISSKTGRASRRARG